MSVSAQSPAAACANQTAFFSQLASQGHCAIVGLHWGDEGKGKIVDLLAEQFDLIVRYNGGANAGHSVEVGDQRYALHLIPSGILNPSKINVVANGVVLDPAQLLKEIKELTARGIKIGDNLRISNRAHVVFPWHKLHDGLMEQAIAKGRGDGKKIGTTGRGIGPCYADKAERSTGFRVGELLDGEHFREKLTSVLRIKNLILAALAKDVDAEFTPLNADAIFEEYTGYANTLKSHICDTTELLHNAMDNKKRILFEGANATLLDIDHGTYPYVTSSNCSSLGVHPGTGIPGQKLPQVMGIMKAYSTRVGGGPFPTELFNATGEKIREVGREYGTTTGRPRRVGWLDLVATKYSAKISGATAMGLMLLDVLGGHEKLNICTGYRYEGKTLEAFPSDAAVLAKVEPILEEVEGFDESVSKARTFDQLPKAAQAYVQRVEKYVGVPVRVVSVGPKRDQTLFK